MRIKVVIDGLVENTKIDQYQVPSVLGERADLYREINEKPIPIDRTLFEKSESDIDVLKAAKKAYKKQGNNTSAKKELLSEILSHKTPNWGSVKIVPTF